MKSFLFRELSDKSLQRPVGVVIIKTIGSTGLCMDHGTRVGTYHGPWYSRNLTPTYEIPSRFLEQDSYLEAPSMELQRVCVRIPSTRLRSPACHARSLAYANRSIHENDPTESTAPLAQPINSEHIIAIVHPTKYLNSAYARGN